MEFFEVIWLIVLKKKLDNFTKSLFIIIATFWNDTCEASRCEKIDKAEFEQLE